MVECFKCKVSENQRDIYEGIFGSKIVNICKKCSSEEHIPLIKKPTHSQIENIENKSLSVYERLSKAAGIKNPEEHRKKTSHLYIKRQQNIKQNADLKTLIETNLYKRAGNYKKPLSKNKNLVDNFHWIIMRARRSRKLTHEQLAEEIREPETIIKMAEKGKLPNNYYNLIKKIEACLNIKLLKNDFNEEIKYSLDKETKIEFTPWASKSLTISDLRKIKKRKEEEILKENGFNVGDTDEVLEEIDDEDEESKRSFKDLMFWKKKKAF